LRCGANDLHLPDVVEYERAEMAGLQSTAIPRPGVIVLCDIVPDFVRDILHLAVRIFLQVEMEGDVVVRIARGDVNVKMKDGLSCDFAVIGKEVESFEIERFDHCLGDFLRYQH
jgi:hypothetical protein